MPYTVALPDGRNVEFPDDVPHDKAAEIIRQQFGQAGPRTGLLGDVARGAESAFSTAYTGLASLANPNAAAAAGVERGKEIEARYPGQDQWEAVQKAYKERGLLPAVGEYLSQAPHAIAEQAPQMATAIGGATAGEAAMPVGGGLIGAFVPSYLQQYGGFLERQAQEQQAAGKPVDVSRTRAALAAVPAAAIDVAETLIPMGKGLMSSLFGKGVENLLARGATEQAQKVALKKLAEESFTKTLLKGTATGLGVELPGEVTQQLLERAQAGLPLFNDEALSEYGKTAFQTSMVAPVGAIGRMSDKSAAQQNFALQQRQQATDQATDQAAAQQQEAQRQAQEQEAFRQTPEYLDDVSQRYNTLQKQFTDLQQKAKAKVDPTDLAGVADKKEAAQQFAALRKAPEYQSTIAEYRQALPQIQQRQAQQAQAAQQTDTAKQLAQLQQAPGYQAQLPGFSPTETVTPPQAAPEEEVDHARNARLFEQHLDDVRTQAQNTTNLDQKIALGRQYDELQAALKESQAKAAAQQTAAKPSDVVMGLVNKLKKATDEGDVSTQAKLAQRLRDEHGITDLADVQPQLTKQGNIPLKPFQGTAETREQFALRRPQEFLPGLQANEQEQQTLEESRAADAKAAAEAERNRKLAPEELALRRMAEPTIGERIQRATAQPEEGTTPSPAMGRTAQELQSKALGTDLMHTALEPQAQEEQTRKFQKGPGGGFRLFNEPGAAQRPADYESVSQRIAQVLAKPNLSNDAYNFLRRAENVLPALANRPQEQQRGIMAALDAQLTKIEQGQEGIEQRPQIAKATQRMLGFDVATERPVIRGPSASTKPLSLQNEIEPAVRELEQGAQENTTQGELFPEEAEKTAFKRQTRPAFVQAMRSKAVEAKRQAAKEEKAAPKNEAAERRKQEALRLAQAEKDRTKQYAEQQKRLEAMYGDEVKGTEYPALTEAQRLAREGKPITFSKEELNIIKKNPARVLAGYRSEQTAIERKIKKSQDKSRNALLMELEPMQKRLAAIQKRYDAAKGSGARDQLGALLDKANQDYDKAVDKVTTQDIVWVGKQKDINDLATAIKRVDWLETQMESGRIATNEERVPGAAKVKVSAEQKQALAEQTRKEQVEEAKTRANAPRTSGAALTRSEVTAARKSEKTVYSSKGVPKTTDEIARVAELMRKEQAKKTSSPEEKEFAARIAEKLKSDKPLNPFEENFIVQRSKAAAVKATDKTSFEDGLGTDYFAAPNVPLSEAATAALNDKNLLAALDDVAKNGSLPFLRENAAKLRDLVMRTKVDIRPDLTLNGKRVPALYSPSTNTVAFDPKGFTEANLIHEATHAATLRAWNMPEDKLTPEQRGAKKELTAMFNKLKADGVLEGEYASEDPKEFISEVQSNANLRDILDKEKWFGDKPMLRRAFDALLRLIGFKRAQTTTQAAQDAIEKLYMQSAKHEAASAGAAAAPTSSIVGYENKGKLQELKDNFYGLAARTQFVDRLAAADAAIIKGEGAGKLSSTEAFQAQYFMRMGDNVTQAAGQFVTHGPVRIVAEKTKDGTEYRYESQKGANLVNMSESMELAGKAGGLAAPEVERMVTVLAAGARAEATPNGWARLMSDNPAAARAEYMKDKAFLDANPEVKKHIDMALKEYKTYNDGLVDFAQDCDFLSKAEATRLKSAPYVPFYRVDEGAIKLFIDKEHAITIGSIADNPDLKQMLGDNKKIMPIMTSAVQNTFMLSRAAMKNKATLETADALHKAGFVSARGVSKGPANPDTVHYKFKGENAFATIDADTFGIPAHLIVKGMEGIKTTIPTIVKMMGVPSNMLRKFITRNPAYAARQIIRDPVNAYLLSGVDGVPVVNALREMSKMRNGRSDAEEALMRGLAISSNVYSGNEKDMQMFLRDVSAGKSKWDKLMSTADTLALQADAATRAVIYRDSLAKGMSETQAQFRAMESQNFSRRGLSPSIQTLNTLIPFFNAQIQGLDVLYRSLTGKMPFSQRLDVQRKIKARSLLLATGAMAYALMMSDDEAYQKATPDERYGNFFVHLPGVEDPLKLPVPFEIGILTMGTAQALVDAAKNDTTGAEAVKGMAKLLWNSAPGVIPAAAKPFLEAAYNQTMYGPIENQRELELQAGERFRPNTTGIAKQLGGITGEVGISPLMIDHMVNGFTGSLGTSMLHMLDPLFGDVSEEASTSASKEPFIGGLFQGKEGRFLIDRAYERMQDVVQAKNTYEDLLKRGERARAESFAQRYSNLLMQADSAGTFKQRMGKMFTDERAIRGNTQMSRQEKDDILKRIKDAENAEARAYYEATEKTTPR